jgi:chromosome segregation ATPase
MTIQQEIGDKEQEIRQHGHALKAGEAELQDLQSTRNSLNDRRKELWRSIDELKDRMKKIKDDKDRAQRGVSTVLIWWICRDALMLP